MALSANTNVAAAVANYFTDNYAALLQAGTAVPPASTYLAPPTQAFNEWKDANKDNKFYVIGSGSTYKLGSVSGSSTPLPQGAMPVDLNVAYAVQEKELTLTDWVMGRMADEIQRSLALGSTASALSIVPEVDVNTDFSAMSQADLQLMLQRLVKVSKDLSKAVSIGNSADRQMAAAVLGLAAGRLHEAIDQQALFQDQAATLVTGAGEDATKTDDFNETVQAALDLLVQNFSADLESAQAALNALPASASGKATVSSVTQSVSAAVAQRLRAAADVALLATSAEELFGKTADVQQTSDGNVLDTAAASARQAQVAAVRQVLVNALTEPGMQTALVDAMFASAETLGTSELSAPAQESLYRTVAAAVVQSFLLDGKLLEQMATQAANFGNDLSRWLGNEAQSASARDSALSESIA